MHRLWSCSWCIGSILVAVLTRGSAALHDDRYQIHRLEKQHHALRRRDGVCTSGYTACAASDNGGCCPNNYACAPSYCYAATAGPNTACGLSGYYNCPLEDSGPGACCPTGYICNGKNCDQPANAPYTSMSCSKTGYFVCPSSLGGGCCQSGMACGFNTCLPTTPSTDTVLSDVTTTNSAGSTITSVQTDIIVSTPTVTLPTTGMGRVVAMQSTVSKLPTMAASSGSSGGGGLTRGQLGGVIAGVVIVFFAIVAATFIIIRRLNRTAKAVAESKRGSSGGDRTTTAGTTNKTASSHKQTSYVPTTTVTEVDGLDVDPLMMSPSIRPSQLRGGSDSGTSRNHSPARSPPLGDGVAAADHHHSHPAAWPGYYDPVPTELEGVRHPSVDSVGSGGSYYDPAMAARFSGSSGGGGGVRASYDSSVQQHARHWSNASEVSGSADGAHGTSELDASTAVDAAYGRRRRSSSATSVGNTSRPPVAHVRKGSDGSLQHQRGRSDSSTVAAPLGTVSEMGELHGFYGPDRQVGQTAAQLEREDSRGN